MVNPGVNADSFARFSRVVKEGDLYFKALMQKYGPAWDMVSAGPKYQRRLLFQAEPGLVSKFEDWLCQRQVVAISGPHELAGGTEFKALVDALDRALAQLQEVAAKKKMEEAKARRPKFNCHALHCCCFWRLQAATCSGSDQQGARLRPMPRQ